MGDFNAKHPLWGSKVTDFRGKLIETFIDENNLICLNKGEGTRLNYNGTFSHIDLALCSSNFGLRLNCERIDDSWGSDHFPLSVIYESTTSKFIPLHLNYFRYEKADWALYKEFLCNECNNFIDEDNVEFIYENLVTSLSKARDKSIPLKSGNYKHKYSPFWNKDCSVAKKNRKSAEKLLRGSNSIENQINFKIYKNKFKTTVYNAKKEYWENYCTKLSSNSKISNVWKVLNQIKGKESFTKIVIASKSGEFFDNETLANNFATIFKTVSMDVNIDPDILRNRKITAESFIKDYKDTSLKNNCNVTLSSDSLTINDNFKFNELTNVLKKVNIKSSPGIDDIPFLLLVNSPDNIKANLLYLLNASWQSGVIPNKWKHSIIKPILKPNKNKNDLLSYRPISLTSTFSKILEKLVVNRLNWFLDKNNLMNTNQAGFRKTFSTSDPVIRLKYEADFAIKTGNITVAILIDFTRAFDLLWVDGLIMKMMNLHISGNMLKWIRNFLTNRTYQVKVGDAFSHLFTTENGTPQGSALSPLLFLIMVNDFPKLSNFTSDAFFADDCTIWRTGKNYSQIHYHLQKDLNTIGTWCKKWGLMINTEKTIGIVFTNKKGPSDYPPFKIQGKDIAFQSTCKLLGVFF